MLSEQDKIMLYANRACFQRVRIRFTRFDLEDHPSCKYDNVSIVRTIHWTTFCGKNKPVDQVYWRRDMGVTFVSDSSLVFGGFTAEYFAGRKNGNG